jgi:hypothetical protein
VVNGFLGCLSVFGVSDGEVNESEWKWVYVKEWEVGGLDCSCQRCNSNQATIHG